jgi:hypothetical protein
MRIVSTPEVLLAKVDRAYARSLERALLYARKKTAGGQRSHLAQSGRIERQGPRKALLAFHEPYALAQERGAYVKAKPPKTVMHFPVNGGGKAHDRATEFRTARAFRIPKHPYLAPAGRAWPRMLNNELRKEAG